MSKARDYSTKALEREAAQIEAHARDQFDGWVITGETEKFEDAMADARHIRQAITMRHGERAAYLRRVGA